NVYFAAKVDGTSDFKYLWKILVPLSKPTIITIIILKLIECWNSYVWPRLITTDKDFYLVSNGIQLIKEQSMGKADIPGMMAAVVCVSLPLLLLFVVFRKQIMSGVARSGSKG
ncbi:MAG: ABC transporter permease subunit, partial [Anaeroplasmataceae bacterium]|nr:ABC transporter permease subunit [Anaeroplasmataceae bacterium]